MSLSLASINSKTVEYVNRRLKSRGVVIVKFEDGSWGITSVTNEELKALRKRSIRNPLPEHYRNQGG